MGSTLPLRRRRGRAQASRLVAVALSSWGVSALARVLEVTRAAVQHWADPEHRAAITLGDVLAAPPAFATRLLVAALAVVETQEAPAPLEVSLEALGRDLSSLEATVRQSVAAGAEQARDMAALSAAERLCGEANRLCRTLRARLETREPGRGDAP